METHQVRYFLAVGRTLNFTKAAEECNVTQPSLTRAIKKLEDELGGPLFHRERANTHLTELGRAMLPHIEQRYLAAQSARALAEALKRGDVVHLRLGLTNSVPSRLFSDVLNGVRNGVPNFELTVEGGPESQIRDAVLKGDADLVILAENGAIPERVMLHDLDGEDVIDRAKCSGCRRLRQLCTASGVMPRFRHRVDSVEQLLNLVRAGFGVGFTARSSRLMEGLVWRPIEGVEITREVSLATVAGRPFSAATDAFVRLARMRDWAVDVAAIEA